MRIVIPPLFQKIRRVTAHLRLILTDNFLLNDIYRIVHRILCLLTCDAETYSYSYTVTNDLLIIRKPDIFAKKTTVTNFGAAEVQIIERGSPVCIVQPFQSKELPFMGKFLLQAQTISQDATASITVTTHRRCACGDQYVPYNDSVPIGGDLI